MKPYLGTNLREHLLKNCDRIELRRIIYHLALYQNSSEMKIPWVQQFKIGNMGILNTMVILNIEIHSRNTTNFLSWPGILFVTRE